MGKSDGHLLKIRGLFRVQIEEDGKIVSDLGWKENQITNGGILKFLINGILPSARGKKIAWISLGAGGSPAADDTVLEDEASTRVRATDSAIGNNIAQFEASFPPSCSLFGHPITISNVGLFDSGVVAASTLFSGGLIDPDLRREWSINQTVNVTYQVEFLSV